MTILETELKQLKNDLTPNGYLRNKIIEQLQQDNNFNMMYGMGSKFTFTYNDTEHRIDIDTVNNVYRLDNNNQFTMLADVIAELNK